MQLWDASGKLSRWAAGWYAVFTYLLIDWAVTLLRGQPDLDPELRCRVIYLWVVTIYERERGKICVDQMNEDNTEVDLFTS